MKECEYTKEGHCFCPDMYTTPMKPEAGVYINCNGMQECKYNSAAQPEGEQLRVLSGTKLTEISDKYVGSPMAAQIATAETQRKADQALIQPLIEAAEKSGYDKGVKDRLGQAVAQAQLDKGKER